MVRSRAKTPCASQAAKKKANEQAERAKQARDRQLAAEKAGKGHAER